MTILIADDSQICRLGLKKILNELGFNKIIEAEDGRVALKKLSTENISLTFLDWEMPKLNGLQVLNAIRANETTHGLPVFMATSHTDKGKIVGAIKAGISGYIVKPFEKGTIEAKLKETGFLESIAT